MGNSLSGGVLSVIAQSFPPKPKWTAKDIQDLTGKVIIVTGGSGGIGYNTVQQLARKGAKVYLAARNETKASSALERLKHEGLAPGNGEVEFLKVDLSDPKATKSAAERFIQLEKRLDVLGDAV